MKTLILGATGFIGKNISNHFNDAVKVGSEFYDFEQGNGIEKFECCDVIIDCVGRYGGLPYNKKHGKKIYYQNSLINLNIKKLVDLLQPKRYIKIYSACMYPSVDKLVKEETLQENYITDNSVKWSALPQINDIRYLIQSEISFDALVVTNCYGYHDHYDNDKSHIIGSLLNKIKDNKEQVKLIGTGISQRDFVFADDLGKILKILLAKESTNTVINVSSGNFLSIKETVDIIVKEYNYTGRILWGNDSDNGVLFKGLDNTKLKNVIGQFEFTSFQQGIQKTIKDFKQTQL